jgi:hypothetical protein
MGYFSLWCYNAIIFSLQVISNGNAWHFEELLQRFMYNLCARWASTLQLISLLLGAEYISVHKDKL